MGFVYMADVLTLFCGALFLDEIADLMEMWRTRKENKW